MEPQSIKSEEVFKSVQANNK